MAPKLTDVIQVSRLLKMLLMFWDQLGQRIFPFILPSLAIAGFYPQFCKYARTTWS